MAVSSRGQDTWFSATGPGFDSPYRYQTCPTRSTAPTRRTTHTRVLTAMEPGGRPKGSSRLLRQRYGEDAKKLVDAMDQLAFSKEGSPSSRYRMLSDLLDRHSGKPTQAYEHADPEGLVVTQVVHKSYPNG